MSAWQRVFGLILDVLFGTAIGVTALLAVLYLLTLLGQGPLFRYQGF